MRLRVSLLAAVTVGLAAAQTITTGPSDDLGQCIIACGERAIQDNPAAASKCTGLTDQEKQTQCICKSDALVTELGTCMSNTCPGPLGGIDIGQKLDQTCDRLNAAPRARAGGLPPVVAAAGALFAVTILF